MQCVQNATLHGSSPINIVIEEPWDHVMLILHQSFNFVRFRFVTFMESCVLFNVSYRSHHQTLPNVSPTQAFLKLPQFNPTTK